MRERGEGDERRGRGEKRERGGIVETILIER